MPTPSLIAGLDANEPQPTEEQIRAEIAKFQTPKLDTFRASISKMKTSELIGWITHPESLAYALAEENDPEEAVQMLTTAAMIGVIDEIDRRIPVPA